MSLTETPVQTVDNIEPELDSPIYVAASSCALIDVHLCLFVGTRELGFFPRRFVIRMDDDSTYILVISSTIVTGMISESLSLEISIIPGLLCIP